MAGAAAAQRLPLQGDDAGGGRRTPPMPGQRLAVAGAGDARRAALGRLFAAASSSTSSSAAHAHDYPQHPHDPPLGHVAAGRRCWSSPVVADRPVPADLRRRRWSSGTAPAAVGGAPARLSARALARRDAGAAHERRRARRRPAALLALPRRSTRLGCALPRPDAKTHLRRRSPAPSCGAPAFIDADPQRLAAALSRRHRRRRRASSALAGFFGGSARAGEPRHACPSRCRPSSAGSRWSPRRAADRRCAPRPLPRAGPDQRRRPDRVAGLPAISRPPISR